MIKVFNFNMKAQPAVFPKDLTKWLTREPFIVLMDIITMLPKILLFLETFSTNKALKGFHLVFAGDLIILMKMKFVSKPFPTLDTVKWFFRCLMYLFVMR